MASIPFMGYCHSSDNKISFNKRGLVTIMIVYDKLWLTLKEKGISQYRLINEFHISSGQLDRLRKNSNVNTYTLNQLCEILNCGLEDIAEHIPDKQVHVDKC